MQDFVCLVYQYPISDGIADIVWQKVDIDNQGRMPPGFASGFIWPLSAWWLLRCRNGGGTRPSGFGKAESPSVLQDFRKGCDELGAFAIRTDGDAEELLYPRQTEMADDDPPFT